MLNGFEHFAAPGKLGKSERTSASRKPVAIVREAAVPAVGATLRGHNGARRVQVRPGSHQWSHARDVQSWKWFVGLPWAKLI